MKRCTCVDHPVWGVEVDAECPLHGWDYPMCDGCAQLESECLCDVDISDVLNCEHPSHPGCRLCEVKTGGE